MLISNNDTKSYNRSSVLSLELYWNRSRVCVVNSYNPGFCHGVLNDTVSFFIDSHTPKTSESCDSCSRQSAGQNEHEVVPNVWIKSTNGVNVYFSPCNKKPPQLDWLRQKTDDPDWSKKQTTSKESHGEALSISIMWSCEIESERKKERKYRRA